MHLAAPFVFLLAALTAPLCHAANYHKASPPNVIVLDFPSGDLPVNSTLFAGFDGAGMEVPGDYYGFAWNTTLSLILPNGTHIGGASVGNIIDSAPGTCGGKGTTQGLNMDTSVPNAGADGTLYNQTASPGTYTVVWNVTYGTSTDPAVANETSCDLSRLSYETFVFSKTVNVGASTSAGAVVPTNTKEQRTFQPTGLIMSNDAAFTKNGALFVLVGVLCALLQVW